MVPKVNSSIWDSLQPRTRYIDLKLQKVLKSLIKGTTAFSTGLSDPKDNEQDSLTCLANANFELNMLRHELIKPELNQRFSQRCKPTVPVTEYLFGNDLIKQKGLE